MILAYADDQSVHLVEDLRSGCAFGNTHLRRLMRGAFWTRWWLIVSGLLVKLGFAFPDKLCRAERTFEKLPNVVVSSLKRQNAVTIEYPARICVDDKHRVVAAVEQNGVGGLRADTVQFE